MALSMRVRTLLERRRFERDPALRVLSGSKRDALGQKVRFDDLMKHREIHNAAFQQTRWHVPPPFTHRARFLPVHQVPRRSQSHPD